MMEWVLLVSHIVLWLLVLGLAFLLLGVLRTQGLLSWRLAQLVATTPSRIGRNGLKPGAKAPTFTLPKVGGGEVSLDDFAGSRVLLVFVQTGCGPCHDIAAELNQLVERDHDLQVLVVNNAAPDAARAFACEVNARFPILVQEKLSVSKRYEAFATPFAFLIDERSVVAAAGIVSSKEHLGYLFSSAVSGGNEVAAESTTNFRAKNDGTARGELSDSISLSSKEFHHV